MTLTEEIIQLRKKQEVCMLVTVNFAYKIPYCITINCKLAHHPC